MQRRDLRSRCRYSVGDCYNFATNIEGTTAPGNPRPSKYPVGQVSLAALFPSNSNVICTTSWWRLERPNFRVRVTSTPVTFSGRCMKFLMTRAMLPGENGEFQRDSSSFPSSSVNFSSLSMCRYHKGPESLPSLAYCPFKFSNLSIICCFNNCASSLCCSTSVGKPSRMTRVAGFAPYNLAPA